MNKNIFFLITIFFCFLTTAIAQNWSLVQNIPATDFSALEISNNTIYAGTGNKLFQSTDNGQTWQTETVSTDPVEISCIFPYDHFIYAGTFNNGIYLKDLNSPAAGWINVLPNISIMSFVVHQQNLYAASMGEGIFKINTTSCIGFSNNLPTYAHNVSKIISTPNYLIAIAGANGTFYKNTLTPDSWSEDFYQSSYVPGLDMSDIVNTNGTLYVSRSNKLLRSDDFGDNWFNDNVGLTNGSNRTLYVGSQNIYSITTDFGSGTNYTRFHQRPIAAVSQTSWNTIGLPFPHYTYTVRELNNNLFIATNEGLYSVPLNELSVEEPSTASGEAVVYPNPSSDGAFCIQSKHPIESITVFDSMGKTIETQPKIATNHFFIPYKGFYLIRVVIDGAISTKKVMVQ